MAQHPGPNPHLAPGHVPHGDQPGYMLRLIRHPIDWRLIKMLLKTSPSYTHIIIDQFRMTEYLDNHTCDRLQRTVYENFHQTANELCRILKRLTRDIESTMDIPRITMFDTLFHTMFQMVAAYQDTRRELNLVANVHWYIGSVQENLDVDTSSEESSSDSDASDCVGR